MSADFLELPAYAPIRPLLLDPEVTEIMINGHREVFVERRGRMELSPFTFDSEQALNNLIELIVRPSGRSVDATWPYVDCRLPDGSRVNVIIPPLSLGGATVTIRKFTHTLKAVDDLVRNETLSAPMAELHKRVGSRAGGRRGAQRGCLAQFRIGVHRGVGRRQL